MFDKLAIIYIFLGGGLGSVVRYVINVFTEDRIQFPLGTFISNALASLILGAVIGLLVRNQMNEYLGAFLAIGFCGGFSTFSSFSKDNVELLMNGEMLYMLFNIFISLLVGMGLFFIAFYYTSKF